MTQHRCTWLPRAALSSLALSGLALSVLAPGAGAQLDRVFAGSHVPVGAAGTTHWSRLFAAADVNLDGLADLIAHGGLPSGSNQLWITFALPGGGFAEPRAWDVQVPGQAVSLVVADVDADGWPDVVTGTDDTQAVLVIYGTGQGSFGWSASYCVGSGPVRSASAVDVDHDGQFDLLSASAFGTIDVNLADGSGGYLPTHTWPTGAPTRDMASGDLDGDGWVDVVMAGGDQVGTLQTVLADGAGGFGAPSVQACAAYPARVLLGDLDGDADLDALLITQYGPEPFSMAGVIVPYLNDGAGTLQAGTPLSAGEQALAGLLADLDQDGDLDALTAALGTGDIGQYENDGSGAFSARERVPVPHAVAAALADADGDGRPDLIAFAAEPTAVILPGRPEGWFSDPEDTWLNHSSLVSLDVADVNGDGWPDTLACCPFHAYQIELVRGSPDGFVMPPVPCLTTDLITHDTELGDVTGDGVLDVVAVSTVSAAGTTWYVQVGAGAGDGSFAPFVKTLTKASHSAKKRLGLADFDRDGWLDVAVVSGDVSGYRIHILRNLGPALPGQFGEDQVFPVGSTVERFELAQLDGDGSVDVVLLCEVDTWTHPPTLVVCAGDGHGGVLPAVSVSLPAEATFARRLAVADMDLDGHLDAVVTCEDGRLVIARGDGTGALVPGELLAAPPGSGGWMLVAGDLDGDGWPDVAQAGRLGTTDAPHLVVRRGDGAGGLKAPELHDTWLNTMDGFLVDMNRDDRTDLLAYDLDPAGESSAGHVHTYGNLHAPFTWVDLGHATGGAQGEPRLTGTGALLYGTPGVLRLQQAAPSSLAALILGLGEQPAPWKGGVLVPAPPLFVSFFVTDTLGSVLLAWDAWPEDNPGASASMQFVIADPAAAQGVAFSNAVRATEPE